MDIGNKLKYLRKKLNLSQNEFAKVLGISAKSYWNYENGNREVPAACLANIAHAFRLNLNWLFCDEGDMIQSEENIYQIGESMYNNECYNIPVRGEVKASCGYGVTVYDENETATYSISRKFINDIGINPKTSEIIFASGNSMEPTIAGCDSLLVDNSRTIIHDGRIYCIRLDGELYAKRLQKLEKNKILIISDNPQYKAREVQPGDDFNIIGEVRWWGRIAK